MNKLFIKIFNRAGIYDLPIRLDRIRTFEFDDETFSAKYWIIPSDNASTDTEIVEFLFEKDRYEKRKEQLQALTFLID